MLILGSKDSIILNLLLLFECSYNEYNHAKYKEMIHKVKRTKRAEISVSEPNPQQY